MSDEFVTVATIPTVPEAETARLMLESDGVPAIVSDAEVVNMDWLLGNAVEYVKVRYWLDLRNRRCRGRHGGRSRQPN